MASAPEEQTRLSPIAFAAAADCIFEACGFILPGSGAPIIAARFFARVSETTAFMFALMTFAAGYFIRLPGGRFFGLIGRLYRGAGRRFLITISIRGAQPLRLAC